MVTAEFRNLSGGFVSVDKLVLGKSQTTFDYIIHTGDAKDLFVTGLQITGADVKLSCHIRYIPVLSGIVINFFAQLKNRR